MTLAADREGIGQVLTSLLTSALKYSPLADTAVMTTLRCGEFMVISVQDFGIGIPQEYQSHLFERFYRVEGETRLIELDELLKKIEDRLP